VIKLFSNTTVNGSSAEVAINVPSLPAELLLYSDGLGGATVTFKIRRGDSRELVVAIHAEDTKEIVQLTGTVSLSSRTVIYISAEITGVTVSTNAEVGVM